MLSDFLTSMVLSLYQLVDRTAAYQTLYAESLSVIICAVSYSVIMESGARAGRPSCLCVRSRAAVTEKVLKMRVEDGQTCCHVSLF